VVVSIVGLSAWNPPQTVQCRFGCTTAGGVRWLTADQVPQVVVMQP
jgi:hypothetical protein